MSTTTPPAAPPRAARCRMRDRLGDPCPNEALDSDEGAIQICVKHAHQAVELLAEHGAITYRVKFNPKETP